MFKTEFVKVKFIGKIYIDFLESLSGSMVALLPCMHEVPGSNPSQTQKSTSEIAQFIDILMKPKVLKRAFLCYLKQNLSNLILLEKFALVI